MASAKHSSAQKQVGWWIDNWTAARVRVGAIWKYHAELTAMEVKEPGQDSVARLPLSKFGGGAADAL